MERLSAEDYYRTALAVLGEHGSDALTIAELCDRLHITKGSFYHHFGSMAGFVDGLLDFWEREHSERLIEASRTRPDPRGQVVALTDYAVHLPHESEAAIRGWAKSSVLAADAVERVDRRRDRAVVDAVMRLGIPRARAEVLARLALTVLVGVQTRERVVDTDSVRELFDEVLRMVFAEADPAVATPALASAD